MLRQLLFSSLVIGAGLTVGRAGVHDDHAAPSALDSLRVDHVMVNAADFDRSVTWYRDMLGFRPVVTWTVDGLDGTRLAYLERHGFMIEIASGPTTNETASLPRPADFTEHFAQRGFTHLCFTVDDVDAALAELNARGVPTFSSAIDFPALGVRVGFVQDPDGNVIELKGPLAGRDVLGGNAQWHADRPLEATNTASASAETTIRAKLAKWRELWSQTGAGKIFSLENYEDLFDTRGENLLVFDSYVPVWASTQIDGFEAYRTIWNRDVNESFPGWTIKRMDVIRVEVASSGDLAWSALNFWGEGTRPDGSAYEGSQHGTHVWRRIDGDWRIVHEHLTSPIMVRGVPNAPIGDARETESTR